MYVHGYGLVFIPCIKHSTFHPLVDLFLPTQSQLLWEDLSPAAITALSVASYSFMQLSEVG